VDIGVHLPLIDFGHGSLSLSRLFGVVEAARRLGYRAIAANDHLVFSAPWLDGPIALAAVVGVSGTLDLMTTVALPVVRGPVPLAKTLGALDVLSDGRLIAGVGPGSSARDYAAVDVPFGERWARFDRSITVLRQLLGDDSALAPHTPGGPPLWVGSWGSPVGLRRVAQSADGWLASAYNITPESFAAARRRLDDLLADRGRDPAAVPDGLSTAFLYLVDRPAQADHVLEQVLAPTLKRPVADLRDRLLIGTVEQVADLVGRYERAGLRRLLVWPVADEAAQLEAFASQVLTAF
jgi:alkanesulfonate monooxygenase SsuD/methylene tetrahydromethanopterin reductase-like flavin-dependent oxidoreductase (luciferase family)